MDDDARPIWILAAGCQPIALVTIKRKRFPAGVTHWCHEGDGAWTILDHEERERLERLAKVKRKKKATFPRGREEAPR